MTVDASSSSEGGAVGTSASTTSPTLGPASASAPGAAGPVESGGAGGLNSSAGDAFDEGGNDAYAGGRQVLSPGAVTVMAARDAQVSIQPYLLLGTGRGIAATPGPVRPEQLAAIRDRYVEVPEYTDLESALRARRLIVLIGPAGTGRSTTALHLLDDVSDGNVSRLDDPNTTQPDHIEAGHGYLGELTPRRNEPTQVQADRLADVFERRDAFCVLVATADPLIRSAYAAYASPCSVPERRRMLALHIDAQLRADDADGVAQQLIDLAETAELRDALGPAPRPHEVAAFAGLLVAHGRRELTQEEILVRAGGLLDSQVSEWFSGLRDSSLGERAERARRLVALRIAGAVFDDMPRHYTTDTADALSGWMAQPPIVATGRAPAPIARTLPRMPDVDDDMLLETSRMQVERGTVRIHGGAAVAASILRFRDPRTPVALLRHVWDRHMWLRTPIITWLVR